MKRSYLHKMIKDYFNNNLDFKTEKEFERFISENDINLVEIEDELELNSLLNRWKAMEPSKSLDDKFNKTLETFKNNQAKESIFLKIKEWITNLFNNQLTIKLYHIYAYSMLLFISFFLGYIVNRSVVNNDKKLDFANFQFLESSDKLEVLSKLRTEKISAESINQLVVISIAEQEINPKLYIIDLLSNYYEYETVQQGFYRLLETNNNPNVQFVTISTIIKNNDINAIQYLETLIYANKNTNQAIRIYAKNVIDLLYSQIYERDNVKQL